MRVMIRVTMCEVGDEEESADREPDPLGPFYRSRRMMISHLPIHPYWWHNRVRQYVPLRRIQFWARVNVIKGPASIKPIESTAFCKTTGQQQ
jgi:hypothetical protein